VTDFQNGNASPAIVITVLALAENFKHRAVAGGIEKVSQQRILTALGCHYGLDL
jgi:EAL domain-containing protein (putative c-di-GMP-specific phosphodiesterase class I)